MTRTLRRAGRAGLPWWFCAGLQPTSSFPTPHPPLGSAGLLTGGKTPLFLPAPPPPAKCERLRTGGLGPRGSGGGGPANAARRDSPGRCPSPLLPPASVYLRLSWDKETDLSCACRPEVGSLLGQGLGGSGERGRVTPLSPHGRKQAAQGWTSAGLRGRLPSRGRAVGGTSPHRGRESSGQASSRPWDLPLGDLLLRSRRPALPGLCRACPPWTLPAPLHPSPHLPGHPHPPSSAAAARGHGRFSVAHAGAVSGSAGHREEGRPAAEPREP